MKLVLRIRMRDFTPKEVHLIERWLRGSGKNCLLDDQEIPFWMPACPVRVNGVIKLVKQEHADQYAGDFLSETEFWEAIRNLPSQGSPFIFQSAEPYSMD